MEYLIYDTIEEATSRSKEIDEQLGLIVEEEGVDHYPFSTKHGLTVLELTDGRFALCITEDGLSAMKTSKVLPNGKVLIKYDIISNQEENNLKSHQYMIDNNLLNSGEL